MYEKSSTPYTFCHFGYVECGDPHNYRSCSRLSVTCGRVSKTYKLPLYGFARDKDFQLVIDEPSESECGYLILGRNVLDYRLVGDKGCLAPKTYTMQLEDGILPLDANTFDRDALIFESNISEYKYKDWMQSLESQAIFNAFYSIEVAPNGCK